MKVIYINYVDYNNRTCTAMTNLYGPLCIKLVSYNNKLYSLGKPQLCSIILKRLLYDWVDSISIVVAVADPGFWPRGVGV